MSETPFESPVEDVAEQRAEVLPDEADREDREREGSTRRWDGPGWDADPADAQEQDAEVPIDEDEWR